MVHRIALIRHGESVWNLENLFTGWTDVDLSDTGRTEARWAGKLLRTEGFKFDQAYTSVLKRAINTLQVVLENSDQLWIPVEKTWRLNERHYGDLQGKNKAETAKKYGDEQVHIWRRSYDVPPAPLTKDDERWPGKDRRYAHLDPSQIPLQESLKETVERFLPYWHETIAPVVKSGKNVIIAAHGNSLRALVKYLDNISDKEIPSLEIPTGVPLIYELDDNLKPIRHYYVGTKDAFKKRLGVIGTSKAAERLTQALIENGVATAEAIQFHVKGGGQVLAGMHMKHTDDDTEVVSTADLIFVFGSAAEIRDHLKNVKDSIKDRLIVPVTKEGQIDTFQEAAGGSAKIVLAVSEKDLEPPHPTLDVHEIGAPVKLIKGASASDKDVEVVKTLIEAAGYPVPEQESRQAATAGG